MTIDDIPPGTRIAIDDIRAAGHCAIGVRRWFQTHDLDFTAFLRDGGMDATEFCLAGDDLALRCVELKLERDRG